MKRRYVVQPPADGKWGVKDKDGNWNGMVGMVQKNEVLIAVASMVVTDERRQIISFTDTIDRQPYTFMYGRPQELSRALIFIEPFTPRVRRFTLITPLLS
jgi:hypothetical protein